MKLHSNLSDILFVLILFLSVFAMSCEKECPDGYSGKDCEIAQSETFTGNYDGYVNCGFTDEFTEVVITRNKGPFDIIVDLISTPDFILEATVSGDSIIFPRQWIGVPQGQDTSYYIIGATAGVLKMDTLRFPIRILFPGITDSQWLRCDYTIYK